jgi:type VI secretion system protein ImpF
MPRVDSQIPLLPSVLDRLIDNEPDVSTEPAWRQSLSLREFERSVLRDLESLLNTRQTRTDLPADMPNAGQSVLTYGLPDFSSCSVGNAEERERLRMAVQQAIQRFEPRLRDIRVTLHDKEGEFDRALRLTIEGLLWVHPDPQPIAFDTLVQPATGQCVVKTN